MTKINNSFDDFVDGCFLDDDTLCDYKGEDLDLVIQNLISIHNHDWEAYQDVAA